MDQQCSESIRSLAPTRNSEGAALTRLDLGWRPRIALPGFCSGLRFGFSDLGGLLYKQRNFLKGRAILTTIKTMRQTMRQTMREIIMIRKIISIDEEACNGCGLCVTACHEGAIGMVEGKARLLRDDYCDGLGDCLPTCPTGAITFVEREAEAYDEAAVLAAKKKTRPSSMSPGGYTANPSELASWPVEIKLAPMQAPYFNGASLLIAADCTAFAYADFHRDFMKDHVTLIACPKLDAVDYSQKLEAIFTHNKIDSVTVARMEVPCCGGLEHAARTALERSGKNLPFEVAILSTQGGVLERR